MRHLDMLTRGHQRYHVTLGPKRTTVSLDNQLSVLLSLKLGFTPATPQAQRAVRHWLQARLDDERDHGRLHASQWLGEKVLRALISTELTDRYNQWLDDVLDGDHHRTQPASPTAIATASKSG
jgi:hypothetical protein